MQNKRILSQNAFYNDQLSLCDSDGDGMVAVAEAQAFNPSVVTWPHYPPPQPASVAGSMARPTAPMPLSTEAESRPSVVAQPTSMRFAPPEVRFAQ